MNKTKPISQQLAEETFKELGIPLDKKGKPMFGKKLRESRRNLGHRLVEPLGSEREIKKPPFRIPDLEKTKRQSPKGKAYQYSAVYRNAVILQILVKKFTQGLDAKKYHRLIDQMDSAARSVIANIREGYVRPTSKEYSQFLGFSQGSLEEVKGDIIDAKDDGILPSRQGSSLAGIGIELLKPSPNSSYAESASSAYLLLDSLKRQVGEIRRDQLTYEIFMELINKTDWLLKRAVEGIDRKIVKDESEKLKSEINSYWRKHW